MDPTRAGRRLVISGALVGALTLGAITAHGATGLFALATVTAELPDEAETPDLPDTPEAPDLDESEGTEADHSSGSEADHSAGTEMGPAAIPGSRGQGATHRNAKATAAINKHAITVLARVRADLAARLAGTPTGDTDGDHDEDADHDGDGH